MNKVYLFILRDREREQVKGRERIPSNVNVSLNLTNHGITIRVDQELDAQLSHPDTPRISFPSVQPPLLD